MKVIYATTVSEKNYCADLPYGAKIDPETIFNFKA